MINPLVMAAFFDEATKEAGKQKAAKITTGKALGILGLGAVGGMGLEQAKDDLMSGRRSRKSQAQAMGVSPLTL
jgi:hypothetical protein